MAVCQSMGVSVRVSFPISSVIIIIIDLARFWEMNTNNRGNEHKYLGK